MKDMGRVMALVKERLGGLDRAGPRQRAGQGRARPERKKGPAASERRSPMNRFGTLCRCCRCRSVAALPVMPVRPSMIS